ncbi:hypothetical protein PDQ34_22850 [Bacillus cereus]|nr:hypothetical protein [Bacillus cereus]MDA2571900.1 hypothetical protein [Bacillus cereus]
MDDTVTYMFAGSFIMFLIQIVAIVLSCCVNKMNNKLYGGLAFRALKEPDVQETI